MILIIKFSAYAYIDYINACHVLPIRNIVYAHLLWSPSRYCCCCWFFFKFSDSWLFLYKFYSMPLFYRSIEAHNFHGHLALNIALHLRIYSTRCYFFHIHFVLYFFFAFFNVSICDCVLVFFTYLKLKKLSDFNLDVFFFAQFNEHLITIKKIQIKWWCVETSLQYAITYINDRMTIANKLEWTNEKKEHWHCKTHTHIHTHTCTTPP